jgi:ATP-dependent Clp protease adaptor protein ClpS
MADEQRDPGGEVLDEVERQLKEPDLYQVVLLNDDYTTMDFVVQVLEEIFHRQPSEAFRIMMQVHTQGRGICGQYPYEVAETKVAAVQDRARTAGFPLQATMEKA